MISNACGSTDGAYGVVFNLGSANGGSVLSQTFDTVPGATYTVSFDYGEFNSGVVSEIQQLEIRVRASVPGNDLIVSNSEQVLNGTGSNNSGEQITQLALPQTILELTDQTKSGALTSAAPNAEFSTTTFTFIAQTSSSVITFQDAGTDGNLANTAAVIDNVQIIPEPSTVLVFLLGLGTILGCRRSRSQRMA